MSATPGVRNAEVNGDQNRLARASASIPDEIPDVPREGLVGLGVTLGGGYIAGMFGIPWIGLALGLGGFLITRFA
jgi:hypothetical protein